ncbi:MAG: patatin-like phospholipase family protein [Melioribacteraceae bacterium]|nr:patatin-like phospholipase family protein [Melioribacteraceae bacterium]
MAKLGLALGGGGARGLAHIGVLKVLEKEGIEIHSITGCSMGAVVGSLYAYYGEARKVEEFLMGFISNPDFEKLGINELSKKGNQVNKSFFNQFFDYINIRLRAIKTLSNPSYFEEKVTDKIFDILPDVPIENLKINFSAIATDLISGEEINFREGNLRRVVKASSAIPGIFPPVWIDKYLLVDGSASESVPVSKVKEIGADRVLAVDVTRLLKSSGTPQNVFKILYRTEDITSFHLSQERLKEADLVIRPEVKKLTWSDFDHAEEIIAEGEKAANKNIKEIKKLANRYSFILYIWNLFETNKN